MDRTPSRRPLRVSHAPGFFFVCFLAKAAWITSCHRSASDSHCDRGYLLYGNFCYKFEAESVKTWQDAEAHCVSEQAHLASFHSEEELSFLNGEPRTAIRWWNESEIIHHHERYVIVFFMCRSHAGVSLGGTE